MAFSIIQRHMLWWLYLFYCEESLPCVKSVFGSAFMLSWILTNIRHAFLRPTEAIFNRCVLQLISKQLLSFCSHTFPQRFGHNVRYLPLQRHYSDGDISSIITGCCAKTRFYRSLAPWTRFARQVSRDSCFMKISIAAESKERGMEFHQLATKPGKKFITINKLFEADFELSRNRTGPSQNIHIGASPIMA